MLHGAVWAYSLSMEGWMSTTNMGAVKAEPPPSVDEKGLAMVPPRLAKPPVEQVRQGHQWITDFPQRMRASVVGNLACYGD